MTVRQVATFLHVSVSTVRRWSDKGLLQCYHIGSRGDRRYRRRDLLQFFEKHTYDLRTDMSEGKSPGRCRQRRTLYFN